MRRNEETDSLSEKLFATGDVAGWCELFHPEKSIYLDPVFGEYRGRSDIKTWLVEVMGRAGNWRSVGVGKRYFDGEVTVGEAELVVHVPDGEFVLPFAFVQRYEDGCIVYRRDYYDSHELRGRARAGALTKPERGS